MQGDFNIKNTNKLMLYQKKIILRQANLLLDSFDGIGLL